MTLGERIHSVAVKSERLVIGLSSGTSFDGIDAALVRIGGRGDDVSVTLESFVCVPYDVTLRSRIAGALSSRTPELARLSFDIGEAFGVAALRLLEESGLTASYVDLVGSHGQTVFHDPPTEGRAGATLQIGEADIIASRTGLLTVSDFRTADVAAGGSGAPLVPLVDWLLFRKPGEAQVLLNIGGIANLTYVTEELSGVVAFDTGPGNALLDEIARAASWFTDVVDEGGKLAASGTPSEQAVTEFLRHPYFAAPPPKSTGKETFGSGAARDLAAMVRPGVRIEDMGEEDVADVLATAAAVTARAVSDAFGFLPDEPVPSRVLVSGGGLKNRAIMRELERWLAPCPVVGLDSPDLDPTDRLDPDAKEAVAFAVLADRTLAGEAGNVPSATGASTPVVLGKISPGRAPRPNESRK